MHNIDMLLKSALILCDKEKIPYGKIKGIKVNNRLSKAWGRCVRKADGDYFEIELRNVIADDNITPLDGAMTIIIHEIIHTCDGCFNHGELFDNYAKRFLKYDYDPRGATKNREKINVNEKLYQETMRYLCKCTKCGYVEGRNRMCKFVSAPETFIHKGCNGNFIRIK